MSHFLGIAFFLLFPTSNSVSLRYMYLLYLQIENDEDVLWEPDVREANEAVALRGMKFMDW